MISNSTKYSYTTHIYGDGYEKYSHYGAATKMTMISNSTIRCNRIGHMTHYHLCWRCLSISLMFIGVDAGWDAILVYKDGRRAVLKASAMYKLSNTGRLTGPKGCIEVSDCSQTYRPQGLYRGEWMQPDLQAPRAVLSRANIGVLTSPNDGLSGYSPAYQPRDMETEIRQGK